ncbi:rhodanese-related sulfurtransferase [Candidatus Pacearchaeota archaeon]|nr:rhodanese-related sulfurtransferase [Candidatus Pacearchaeota archaeon]
MDIHILLFYKFVEISDTENLKKIHLDFCNSLGIKGKVLLATEGINGSISGNKEQVEKYKLELKSDARFKDIEFKEEISSHHPFDKMVVKIKKEIIKLNKKIDMGKVGEYIYPEEFIKLIDENKEVIILDTRNDYESNVGKFKNAITPKIEAFRQFPEFIESFKISKDKPIVMYCTGGIRCEKASAYMIQQGFTNIKQLHGGIINFCQKFPNTLWEGSCFVFDKRLTSKINQNSSVITNCAHCEILCDLYRNCKNIQCNNLIFLCNLCEKKFHASCSEKCGDIVINKIK